MQNPPAIPTIPVCWFYCVLMRVQFTIDWHNYAHSLMALNLGKNHALVKLAKIIEIIFGRRASNNFCVTKAMKEDLRKRWSIKLVVPKLNKLIVSVMKKIIFNKYEYHTPFT